MKKSMLALAVLSAFAGAAAAQSSVTLSGRVDAGVIRSAGQWTMGGSQSGYNAFTLSGREDLGGGMAAVFTLNHRFNINNGTVNPGGNASDPSQFWRNAWVGLTGGFGTVRMGRILMPLQDMNGGYDAFDTGYVATVHTGGIGATVRANNAIYYRSPAMGGLFVDAAIAAGEGQAVPLSGTSERPMGFAAGYSAGPLRVGVAYDVNRLDRKTTAFYGGYNMGVANLMMQYEKGDISATADVARWSISAKVPMGKATLKAGYTNWSDENIKKFGLGLQYDLSKRTNLYTNVGKVSGTAASTDAKKATFDAGVTHAF